jgi:hypothetical protein
LAISSRETSGSYLRAKSSPLNDLCLILFTA